jgi:hypothetical protein
MPSGEEISGEVAGHIGERLVEGGEPGSRDSLGGLGDDVVARGC